MDIVKVTKEIASPIAKSLGLEFLDAHFNKEFGNYFLRIFIGKRGGVSIEDCQKMTELISEELDRIDPTDVAYLLEVSSPGLDRPLKTDVDYLINIGEEVLVRLYAPIEDRKEIQGILSSYDDENVYIKLEDRDFEIPKDSISLMNLVIKF